MKLASGEYSDLVWQNIPKELFNDILSKFYVEVRKQDGKPYSKQAYVCLRAGLQRYLCDGPWFKPYTLISDPAFKSSNDTMTGVFKRLGREGLDRVQHHEPIAQEHIAQLKATNVIGTDNPLSLQRLVWLGIGIHFGRRGRENYREMTKSFFTIKKDAEGRRFLQQAYCEKTKNHQGDKPSNSYMAQGRIYEQPGDAFCTLTAYEKYLSLLNSDFELLWQRPNKNYKETGKWYCKQAVGKNVLGNFLKDMCKDAGIDAVYTNHCTRVTTSVILNEAGFGENDIVKVTGHKSTSSLTSYINKSSDAKKRKMADTLSNVFSEGPSTSSAGMASNFGHPDPVAATAATSVVDTSSQAIAAPHTNDIINLNLDNCEELSESDMNKYLEIEENKENNLELTDTEINQYMQIFEKNVAKGSMFSGCTVTINNPIYNITIKK